MRQVLITGSGVALAILTLVASLAAATSAASSSRVITLLDFFESGRSAVDGYVRNEVADGGRLARTMQLRKAACVRVELRFDGGDDGYRSLSASGVLVDGGRWVLTAGHALQAAAGTEVVVTLLDGRVLAGRLSRQRYEAFGGPDRDWAVIELEGHGADPLSAATVGKPVAGELAFILGYPDRIGVDGSGALTFDAGDAGRYLEPLATLAIVASDRPLRLTPRAGSVPTSGMSGAPVFDGRGRLIGIFVSVAKRVDAGTVSYEYNAATAISLDKPGPEVEGR